MINIVETKTPFYDGNGATAIFPYGFRIDDVSHLKVYVDEVLQPYPTNYSVQGVGDDLGGTFTFEAGFIPPVGVGNVVALRLELQTQLLQLSEGRVGMNRLERRGLDVLCMYIQELQERSLRSPKFQPYLNIPNLFIPDPGAGQVWAWNSTGDGMQLLSVQDFTGIVFFSTAVLAGATSATLTHGLGSATAKLVSPIGDWNSGAFYRSAPNGLNNFTTGWQTPVPVGGGLITWGAIL